jgi:DNA adenine methylase
MGRYVEPFAGSACLFFTASPKRALLADINGDLIRTYAAVRDDPAAVARKLNALPRTKAGYYEIRGLETHKLNATEQAARFIYLNRYCFNGLYRTNKSGRFNVPYAPSRVGPLPTVDQLCACSCKLKKAKLLEASFEETLDLTRRGDFVYMDPPYAVAKRRIFGEYSNHAFSAEQLHSLRRWLIRLDKKGIKFLVSYAYSLEGLQLGEGFNRSSTTVLRQISGFISTRRKARELLISNC